ncbi:protease [Haemophilus paracuniculus]|uniref:endopeptidase La n=1 Tax=Haemophilus paracuniculus TaxID=734 RepID=A0A1T0AQL7_9PAST|nr:S16 family serine protease [Haemophilus paracuniculus]OOR98329.1 protease [Haemophilus paracuniculus]
MNLSPLRWQQLSANYSFSEAYQQVDFFDFQTACKQAFQQIQNAPFGSLLIVKSEILPEYLNEIEAYFNQLQNPTLLKTEYNKASLFGQTIFIPEQNRIETIEGIVQQADQKVLILSINSLLADISLWDKLKQALLFGEYQPYCANPIPQILAPIKSQFKLILLGSRDEIATLFNYDDTLYQFGQYTEVDTYLTLDQENIQQWINYLQTSANKWINKTFDKKDLSQFLQAYIRESERQDLISICPTLLRKHLIGIQEILKNPTACNVISSYFAYLENQSAKLNQFNLQDMLKQQIYIETDEEEIGQINGLSVVEFDGVPYAFGEPLRISCNVQYGDGEIVDIERKVELGGNLHSKGILLAQSCLADLLEFPTQLPFSATVAFEQSYGDIDGDSSSLAIFCVLVSALAKLPLPQGIAVTGAIDQFGNVLSVGGVNQKIEGFFNLCQARGLTGKQGVLIPQACIAHLSLKSELVEAVKQGQFSIWAISDVFEATELLLNTPFYPEEQSDKPALFDLIHQNIEQGQERDASGTMLAKFWQQASRLIRPNS